MRQAFRKKGINAISCDLLPADDNSPYHIQADCLNCLDTCLDTLDLIIAHPPCTAVCIAGSPTYGHGQRKNAERRRAVDWIIDLWFKSISKAARVCLENPVGILPFKPGQYINPYQFGHDAQKRTGLWLHNLPRLQPTGFKPATLHPGESRPRYGNRGASGQYKLSNTTERGKIKSITYQGIADAMAHQWSSL